MVAAELFRNSEVTEQCISGVTWFLQLLAGDRGECSKSWNRRLHCRQKMLQSVTPGLVSEAIVSHGRHGARMKGLSLEDFFGAGSALYFLGGVGFIR